MKYQYNRHVHTHTVCVHCGLYHFSIFTATTVVPFVSRAGRISQLINYNNNRFLVKKKKIESYI